MDEEVTKLGLRVRTHDYVIAAFVAVIYAAIWFFLPGEWLPTHQGGKGFLALFVVTSGLAALLASVFVSGGPLKTKDHPAIWLAVQVMVWNPISFRALFALTEWAGLPSSTSGIVSVVLLVMFGLPTSLLGAGLAGSKMWTAAYLARAAQSFVASWVPLFPPVLFLHVLMFAECTNWGRYGLLHRCAFALIVVEQVAAFLWAFLFWVPE